MTGTFPQVAAALPPPPGLARNSFNGPGYKDVDASISKAFGFPKARVIGDNAKLRPPCGLLRPVQQPEP